MKIRCVVLLILLLPLTVSAVTTNGVAVSSAPTVANWDTGWGAAGVTGWDYVGGIDNKIGTAIYLGNGWVITAAHVWTDNSSGNNVFALGGETYEIITDSVQSFGSADLRMFQLSAMPDLPALTLSTGASSGAGVVMIGNGGGTKAWGAQTILSTKFFNLEGSQTYYVADLTDSATDNVRGIVGDSGGASFIYRNGTWELGGIMIAVGEISTAGMYQDSGSGVFNLSAGYYTFSADLSYYRNDILTVLDMNFQQIPEPSAWTLMLSGAGALWLAARRRKFF